MSFQRSFSKSTPPAIPKRGASISLEGFSFKQLEDGHDKDDLVYTGKYEKRVDGSQKEQKRNHVRTSSTSSVSSVPSTAEEIISPVKANLDVMAENISIPQKPALSLSTETTSSPLRTAARAKLETSKDLLSGMKGKIADKIYKTIEEFSGDSSSNSNQSKVKARLLHKTNSQGPAEKEVDHVFHISTPTAGLVITADTKENVLHAHDIHDGSLCTPLTNSESFWSLIETSSPTVNEISDVPSTKKGALSPSQKETVSNHIPSVLVETHPLAKSDVDDDFEDVIEPSDVELLSRSKQNTDDISEFYDTQSEEKYGTISVSELYVAGKPVEDFTDHPGLWTSVQQKSSSKMKRLMKKTEPNTSAVANMSNLHYVHNDHFAFSLEEEYKEHSKEDKGTQEINKTEKVEKSSSKENSTVSLKSARSVILQQLTLEDRILPYQKLITVAVVLFTYMIIPLPSYMSGFIMGTLLASLGWAFYMWLMEPPRLPPPIMLSHVDESPPVPEMRMTVEGEEFLYKGWMTELMDYNADDYHINKTHSIFVSLEGSHLRLQRPKNAIPKRAMWDEVLPKPQFIHQRHYDLPGAKVYLLPHGLVKKRIWSKKYPICIALADKNSHGNGKLKHIPSNPNLNDKKTKTSEMDFETVTEDKCGQNVLYIFARTGREKEEWFKRFSSAAFSKPLANHILEMKRVLSKSSTALKKSSEGMTRHKRQGSTDSANSTSSETPLELSSHKEVESSDLLTFAHYMGRLMPSGSLSGAVSPVSMGKDIAKSSNDKEINKNSHSKDSEEIRQLNPGSAIYCDNQMFWINALIGRCFFDFLRDKWWMAKVKEKLQRKLSKIHVPYFIEELQVTDINMGCEVPGIRNTSKPYIDERGLWVNLDITYAGGFQMTIETKMNLMKLKKASHRSTRAGHSVDNLKSPVTDSDEEDSAESSTDEEEEVPSNSEENPSGGGTSRKLFRYLNKITQSKYFQQATEYKVIKRAMENVSNTPLILSVTVISLVGKMAVNIPPPPSDRLWYGFRGNPHLRLSAKPQVGERAVTITHIVDWIEKKLATEFQRVFVMPNMDDLVIPILVPGEVNGAAITRSASL